MTLSNKNGYNVKENLRDDCILIVDDIKFNISIIESILLKAGYHNIAFATSGREALDKTHLLKPDLILLDLILPDISGFDICKQLKSSQKTHDIAIIVQSAITKPEQKKEAFDLGADDFVNKPIDAIELISRISLQLEKRKLYNRLSETNSKMYSELKSAEQLLTSFLPQPQQIDEAKEKANISIANHYRPSSFLGGDFYGMKVLDNNKIGFYLWDYSGHGVIAAINTLRLNSAIYNMCDEWENPGEYVSKTNNILKNITKAGSFATMFYCLIDKENNKMSYSYASCPSPVLVSFKNKNYKLIDTKEFPLGVIENHQFQSHNIKIDDWDAIVLYSDAIIETQHNHTNEFLTVENFADKIISINNELKYNNPKDIMNKFMKYFDEEYSNNLHDDLTLNIIRF